MTSSLYNINNNAFDLFVMISYILIAFSYLGFFTSSSTYPSTLKDYVNIYISLFLIWRFNPFRKIKKFTELDRKIAFSAGLFIITRTLLNQYIDTIDSIFKKIVYKYKNKL